MYGDCMNATLKKNQNPKFQIQNSKKDSGGRGLFLFVRCQDYIPNFGDRGRRHYKKCAAMWNIFFI